MESLTGHSKNESQTDICAAADSNAPTTPIVTGSKGPDRLTLGKAEGAKVERWLSQIALATRGFLQLTKSDVVNFLIRSLRDELSSKEIQRLRVDHYDPVKHIQWLTPQLKAALNSGNTERIMELQEELRRIQVTRAPGGNDASAVQNYSASISENNEAPKRRRRSKKNPNSQSVVRFEEIQNEIPEA